MTLAEAVEDLPFVLEEIEAIARNAVTGEPDRYGGIIKNLRDYTTLLLSALQSSASETPHKGQKIIDGLRDAINGGFVRVLIDGEMWVRTTERTSQDFAIEFGGYLAKAAESYQRAVDETYGLAIIMNAIDFEPLTDAHRALNSAIYEFRKRAAKVSVFSPSIPEGCVMVPVVPTEAMLTAACDWSRAKYGKPIGNDAANGCWNAMMLAASPTREEGK